MTAMGSKKHSCQKRLALIQKGIIFIFLKVKRITDAHNTFHIHFVVPNTDLVKRRYKTRVSIHIEQND